MQGSLSSLKVLDFSTLLPGPFASLLLADNMLAEDVLPARQSLYWQT
jgi:crotonobetainyl-CoA:carnitine CoA-transferase CaiB-like acyl-CoA transferase